MKCWINSSTRFLFRQEVLHYKSTHSVAASGVRLKLKPVSAASPRRCVSASVQPEDDFLSVAVPHGGVRKQHTLLLAAL